MLGSSNPRAIRESGVAVAAPDPIGCDMHDIRNSYCNDSSTAVQLCAYALASHVWPRLSRAVNCTVLYATLYRTPFTAV